MLVCVRVFGRKFLYDRIKKISGTATIGCRDAVYFAESKRIELEGVVHLLARVNLVYSENDRFAAASQKTCDLLVIVSDSCAGLHHEEDYIRFFDGENDLLADLFLKDVI